MPISVDYQIGRVETAEQTLEASLARIDQTMKGRQPFTPEAEAEERSAAWSTYLAEVDEVDEVLRTEINHAEAARELAEARVANPRMGWSGQELAEYSAHVQGIERDLASYTVAELESQMRAALASTNARLIGAWRDALNARFAALERDPQATVDQRTAAATWSAEFDKRIRERPAAIDEMKAANKRLETLRASQKRAWEIARPRRVEVERRALVSTGRYAVL